MPLKQSLLQGRTRAKRNTIIIFTWNLVRTDKEVMTKIKVIGFKRIKDLLEDPKFKVKIKEIIEESIKKIIYPTDKEG